MKKKVITFGEIMLRMSTVNNQRFSQAQYYSGVYGGAEANAAISLSNFGVDTYFITKIPNNPIAEGAVNYLKQYGVRTDYISRGGDRIGLYFMEPGVSMRPAHVVYDRANSSFSNAELNDFDFDKIFNDAKWFHITGITPALSENTAKLTEEALKVAKKNGVVTSFDINYRSKLWTSNRAKSVLSNLMQYVDVCFAGKLDSENLFGFEAYKNRCETDDYELEAAKFAAKQLIQNFNFKYVAGTLRTNYSCSDNALSAIIYNGSEFYKSKKYEIKIVDRVGGGDAFAAGLIYGFIEKMDFRDALEFATAAAALKHTIIGDANLVSVSEVFQLINSDGTLNIMR